MKKQIVLFVALFLVAIGAGPASSALWNWSKTASSNATADPSINWAEGMSPSSVNDSARAMMARVAEWRDDISGLLTTAGTSTAYTVTTNEGLSTPTPVDGQLLAITVHATNGTAPTLTADGGTTYAIQSSAGVPVPAATLILGSPYTLRFSVANSAWMLRDFYGTALNVPLGALVPYTLSTVPNSNFVFPYGQCLSTTTYAVYWVALGSPASGACPGGQFAILDMRGRNPTALDTLPGSTAANRLTGASTGCGTAMTSVGAVCANGAESHALTIAELAAHTHTITDPGHVHGGVPQKLNTIPPGSPSTNTLVDATLGNSASATTGITVNSTGSGTAHPIVNPNIGVTYLLRVL